jgi:glycosyltransferase involved in cell wall biosynthesis
MNKPNVLHLIDPAGIYGAEYMILNLSTALLQFDCSNAVGVLGRYKEHTAYKQLLIDRGIRTVGFFQHSRMDPAIIRQLVTYANAANVNLLHSHGYKTSILGLLVSKITGIPLIITCHLWYHEYNFKLKCYHALESLAMRWAEAIVAVSRPIQEELKQKVGRQTVLIHNGLDLSYYASASPEYTATFLESMGIEKSDFIIGSIGRLHEQKRFDILIRAASLMRKSGITKFKMIIIGDGPLKDRLNTIIHQLHLEDTVILPGYRHDAINLLKRFDVFAMSSDKEGLPMVLLEAMANSKPVVVSPVGGIEDVIKHGKNGLVARVLDTEDMAAKLSLLISCPEYRSSLGREACRTFMKKLTAQVMANEYFNLYSVLTAKGK